MEETKIAVPVKSASDEREYRIVRLANGLNTLLIHDPEADKGAAAMDVHVGYWSDPDHLPGLAHFLEHMLFLGTEKYPDESEYNTFLNAHGGYSNAYTSDEHTNYYFEVTHDHLEGALDRFAQFFVAPLFTQSVTDREMKAVDNEHAKNINSDGWRLDQLMRHSANKVHPFSKFGTGNLSTLRDIPKASGVDVREALLQFYKTHYSASIMKLCVLGREPLDTLAKWAESMFSAVPSSGIQRPQFDEHVFTNDQLANMYHIVPVKDLRQLKLLWPMPPLMQHYRSKPADIIAHLIGHEGAGSILSLLKSRGWAQSLNAGAHHSETCVALFSVSMELTEEGMNHVEDIVQTVYQYISMIRGCDSETWRAVFTEVADVASMSFRFKSKEEPSDYACSLVNAMQRYPAEDVLSGPWLYQTFDEATVRHYLDYLVPKNMRIHLVARSVAEQCDQKEPVYQTEYRVEALGEARLMKYAEPGVNEALFVPAPNPFIATDFTIKHPKLDAEQAKKPISGPSLLPSSPLRTWFKPDRRHAKPKANVQLRLFSPLVNASPESAVLSALFVRVLEDSLVEYAYDAETAGLSYKMEAAETGIELRVRGYNHKLSILLEKILQRMANLEINEERFVLLREQIHRRFRNFALEQPYRHALAADKLCLETGSWSQDDKAAVVMDLTSDDLRTHMRAFLRHHQPELLVHGNMTKDEALNIANLAHSILCPRAMLSAQIPELRLVRLADGTTYQYEMPGPNPNDSNACCSTFFQLDIDSAALSVRAELLAQILRDPCYNILRTAEQLGYMVFSFPVSVRSVMALRILVQSSEFGADYLDSRIEAFLDVFHTSLASMTEEEFATHRRSLLAAKEEKDKRLSDETSRHWSEITRRTYEFDRVYQEIGELKQLTLADIVSFFRNYVAPNAPQRRKFCVYVHGHQGKQDESKAGSEESKETPDADAKEAGSDAGVAASESESSEASKSKPAALHPAPVDTTKRVHVASWAAFRRSMSLFPNFMKMDDAKAMQALEGDGEGEIEAEGEALSSASAEKDVKAKL